MHVEHNLPLGSVFLASEEMHRSDIDPAAFPVGDAGIQGTPAEQDGGQGGEKKNESAHGVEITKPGREWFCNAEFDLTLTPDPSPTQWERGEERKKETVTPRLLNVAREMAWQLWPALAKGDRLLVPSAPPQDYLDYLMNLGFDLPEFALKSDPNHVFTPFGWNQEASDLNQRHSHPSEHPELAVVAKVNSREFSLQLEAEWGAHFCRTSEELKKWFVTAASGRWVAKGNHGHAGIGQLRFSLPEEAGEIQAALNRILEAQGGLVLEPEQKILVEFGCLFLLSKQGSILASRCHRLLSFSGGGFAGALWLPRDSEFLRWQSAIEKSLSDIAIRLHREGYFGPVGVDVYAWQNGDEVRFRPLVDLNARCSMALPVHGLSRRFPDRAILISQIPSSVPLPKSPVELQNRLGDLHFNPAAKRGVFLITPLMPGPRRHAFAFIGEDESDVKALQQKTLQVLA